MLLSLFPHTGGDPLVGDPELPPAPGDHDPLAPRLLAAVPPQRHLHAHHPHLTHTKNNKLFSTPPNIFWHLVLGVAGGLGDEVSQPAHVGGVAHTLLLVHLDTATLTTYNLQNML